MALKADSQGFLIGDVVTDLRRNDAQLNRIRADVRDIKSALLGATGGSGNRRNTRAESDSTITPPSPRSRNRTSAAATPSGRGSNAPIPLSPAPRNTATPNRGRDSRGRFAGNNNQGGGNNTDPNDKKSQSIISNLASRITSTAAGAAAGAEEADPAIKAFKEVSEPMMRGYQTLLGGGDKKERWYKKIFKELNLFRKDETAFSRAANRSLHNIENTPGGSGGVGSGGGLFGGAGSLMLGAKALLRKVPILGALLGGIGAFGDVSSTEDNNSLTRGEKDKRNGRSIGGAVGTFGGMMAGAKLGAMAGAFGGPIGAAIGGVVGGAAGLFFGDQAGQIIGEKMGEWTTQLREADIPGKIISAWEITTDAIKSGWDGALKLMSDTWGKAKDAANAANDFVKEKTGVDVKAEVKSAYDDAVKYTADNIIPSLADLANKGGEKLKQGVDWVGENTTLGKGVGYIKGLLHTGNCQSSCRLIG